MINAPAEDVAETWWYWGARQTWDSLNTTSSQVVEEYGPSKRIVYLKGQMSHDQRCVTWWMKVETNVFLVDCSIRCCETFGISSGLRLCQHEVSVDNALNCVLMPAIISSSCCYRSPMQDPSSTYRWEDWQFCLPTGREEKTV